MGTAERDLSSQTFFPRALYQILCNLQGNRMLLSDSTGKRRICFGAAIREIFQRCRHVVEKFARNYNDRHMAASILDYLPNRLGYLISHLLLFLPVFVSIGISLLNVDQIYVFNCFFGCSRYLQHFIWGRHNYLL